MKAGCVPKGWVAFIVTVGLVLPVACLWRSPRQGMQRKKLVEPELIHGVPCSAGHAWVHRTGGLGSCALDRDARVAGVELPAGTTVFFTEDGDLDYCWLSRPTVIQGFLCKGRGHGTMTGFYPDGRLKYFWPPEDLELDDVPCKATGFRSVSLHENGSLRGCRLSRSTTIRGSSLRAGDDVVLDESGALVR